MTTRDCCPYRDAVLHHFTSGAALAPEGREHYAACVHCMTAVTAALSGNMADMSNDGPGAVRACASAPKKPVALPVAACQAVAHGRQVLERVFGIRSGNGPTVLE